MFIDADNAPAKHIDKVLTDLAIYGAVSIRKAYGNWKNPVIKSWEDILHEYAIQPFPGNQIAYHYKNTHRPQRVI